MCLYSSPSFAADKSPPLPPQPFLAHNFCRMERWRDARLRLAEAADPANAAVLKEYGFTEFESANYSRDGNKLAVRAFASPMPAAPTAPTRSTAARHGAVTVGEQAVFDGANHIIFWSGNIISMPSSRK